MSDAQDLPRSQSVPILNREEDVLKKFHEQDSIIALMQTQIEFQSDIIAKHDKMFSDLLLNVQNLTSKVKELEDVLSKGQETVKVNAERSALWSGAGVSVQDDSKSIADMAKETAEQTLQSGDNVTGFVYDDKLGLYFDQSSGYYYDPVKQLYYNGHTKTYYSFDSTTNTYKVQNNESGKRKKKSKDKKVTKQTRITKSPSAEKELGGPNGRKSPYRESVKTDPSSDVEEGELSNSPPSSVDSSPRTITNDSSNEGESEMEKESEAKAYPPCIRAVVQTSDNSNFRKGSLFMIPCTGGTIGSKGSHHSILLPVDNVDKVHAKIHYEDTSEPLTTEEDNSGGKYYITDLGSQHGTFLNRVRLSTAGTPSDPCELVHGSTLQIGDIVLLLHIHPGDFTCGHCEPGLVLENVPLYEYTGEKSEKIRRSEIKKIKQKYGLDRKNEKTLSAEHQDNSYTDRAKSRRKKVGSDNPFAKTEIASEDAPIKETNKGFKMLQKMGWKGESLGNPTSEGIKEPIKSTGKADLGGLGWDSSTNLPPAPISTSRKAKQRSENLSKTIERFKEATQSQSDL